MKLAALASLFLLIFVPGGLAQSGGAPRIAEVSPNANVAPGQIVELRVEDLGEQPRLARPGEGRAEGLSGDELRRAEGLAPGALRVSVENRGASVYSAPGVATFELSGRR